MPLPPSLFWYQLGVRFATEVLTGLGDAGAFQPAKSIDEWLDFHVGSGTPPFDGEGCDLVYNMARWCVRQPAARVQFRDGYRAGMRETRTARKLAESKKGGTA